jgi:hypothetical protein
MAEDNKPIVVICAHCQKEFGLDGPIKKAMSKDLVGFSHGICPRHFIETLAQAGINKQAAEASLNSLKQKGSKLTPDLAEHPELVKQYKNEIFTPEEYRQQQPLKEMLQKRAGILHS